MKIDFWLELPTVLLDLIGEKADNEEKVIAKNLLTTNLSISNLVNKVDLEIGKINFEFEEKSREILMNRLKNFEIERTNLVVSSIKFSVKLLKKLFLNLENDINTNLYNYNLYNRLKLSLCVLKSLYNKVYEQICYLVTKVNKESNERLINVNNSNFEENQLNANPEFSFFYLFKIFIEKIENNFYNLSLKLISFNFKTNSEEKEESQDSLNIINIIPKKCLRKRPNSITNKMNYLGEKRKLSLEG